MSQNSPETLINGRVRKYHSNFYYVESDGVLYECMLRGNLKKEGVEVLVGDHVWLDSVQSGSRTARVNSVQLPRKNVITRPKMANVDQAIVVYSLHLPDFDYNQTDRYLTHVELAGLMPVLCVSKADLSQGDSEKAAILELYQNRLGYKVLFSSVHQQDSLHALRAQVQNRITVLAGPSGSGKSSLLNALNPALKLRVGEVSEKIGRGQHTTRHVELMTPDEQEPDTLIADTPGFSNMKFNTVLPVDIARLYRDFAPWREQCAFSDCLHLDEEGCAVLANREQVADSRYASYRDMLAEARQYKSEVDASSQKEEFGYKTLDRKGQDAVKILRLKEKSRDLSRRRIKQQVNQLGALNEHSEDEHLENENLDTDEPDHFPL